MPPEPLMDLSKIDLNNVCFDKEQIGKLNPQRYEMQQLDGIVHLDVEHALVVGFKDVRSDEFWVRGHVPGRPLLPGVLMIEAAAQLASFCTLKVVGLDKFIGFGGVDQVKFRGTVVPPCRLILIAKALQIKLRRSIFYIQEFVDGKMVFEGKVTGMPV